MLSLLLQLLPLSFSGFYVARAKGFYKEAGLEVDLLSPHTDDYKATPASKVADGAATFACVPSESIISHHTWPGGVSQAAQGFVGV
jgi:ABC-type nitrate/sulfonate/bicarbonate transport system substrate-binding protein